VNRLTVFALMSFRHSLPNRDNLALIETKQPTKYRHAIFVCERSLRYDQRGINAADFHGR